MGMLNWSQTKTVMRTTRQLTWGGVWYTIGAKRKRTVLDGGVEGIEMRQIAHVGEYRWKRVQEITEDSRKEPHFETTFKANMLHTDATEVDVFWALMPLSKDALLNIIRDNADVDGDKL